MLDIITHVKNRSENAVTYPFDGNEYILKLFPNFLNSLSEVKFDYNLIVVNGGNELRELIGYDVYTFRIDNYTRGGARNAGAMEASAEWLLFLDADMIVEQGLFDRFAEVCHNIDVYYPICRYWLNPDHDILSDYVYTARGNLFIRREWFRRLGGFAAEGWGKEDVKFFEIIKRTNVRVLEEESEYIYHQWHPAEWRK